MSQTLNNSSLREQVFDILRERLVSGELVPGEIYSASALASEFGVSNSPVREAMLTMVNEGLMESVRNRGFRVMPLSDETRRNVFDVRMLLEVPATARLVEHRDQIEAREQEFRELAKAVVKGAIDRDLVLYLESDRKFHLGLLAMLHNPELVNIVDNLRTRTRLYGLKAMAETGELVKSAEEHHAILDALLNGTADEVAELMATHLSHVEADWR